MCLFPDEKLHESNEYVSSQHGGLKVNHFAILPEMTFMLQLRHLVATEISALGDFPG
jgi:hypothetical protein